MRAMKKRVISWLLAAAMLTSLLPGYALAADETNQESGGLCEHHPAHTVECGYSDPSPGAACTHECSAETGCVVGDEVNCTHIHDETCGYVPAGEGSPCTFRCESCTKEEPGGGITEWPDEPTWQDDPNLLADGEMVGDIYGRPGSDMSNNELDGIRTTSLELPVAEDPLKRIPQGEVSSAIIIYVNGEAYKGGDLTVMEGDNFSYIVGWSPKLPTESITWTEGSWFEAVIFTVPGLNLGSYNHVPMVINGIKVGEYFLNYDKATGEMTYKVVFNRYIQLFTTGSVYAHLQGSGKFVDSNADGPISLHDHNGQLTIEPRPTIPEVPMIPSGIGWKPSKAPTFNNTVYGFGKGVKWDSSGNPAADPQIEWRITFLEQLQKVQQDFLNGSEVSESNGNIIIEDTLDANQEFVCGPNGDTHKYGNAPFFLELPVIVPGTGNILNGNSNVGDGNYDGPGEIYSLYKGNLFTEVPVEENAKQEEIQAVKKTVKETPLTWCVTTDSQTKQQTLLINAGKLGTTDPLQGIVWSNSSDQNWPKKKIQEKIDECTKKIEDIRTGYDSPIALLDQRTTSLNNLLNTGINLPQNQEQIEELKGMAKDWENDFRNWREDPQVSYLKPLEREENGELVLYRPLPNTALIEKLADCVVRSDGTVLKNTREYQNYMTSLTNLQTDQRTYLANRLTYGNDWEAAREHYQKALDFYSTDAVYGFVLKVRSRSINTSMGTYNNQVTIELDDKQWAANDSYETRFASGIIGNYGLGDMVMQKADAYYDETDREDVENIQKVDADQAGLAGAKFKVYCGNTSDPEKVPDLTPENQAHFLDKDASANGDTYRYAHTGTEDPGGLKGEIDELTVNPDGKLVVSDITPSHPHWLVETTAPDGYYLDETPIRFDSDLNQVNYKMLPNVSRSVLLYKTDSYSKMPVEGAEFALYRIKDDGTEEPVTDFAAASLNGHETYVRKDGGTELLKTNAAGELCIHGLDAGAYVLKEVKAAPGYVQPEEDKLPEFPFTLESELPTKGSSYDDAYHLLLNTKDQPLENEPDVAELTLTKTGIGNIKLENAAFALFRFNGTETQWQENPDDETLWKALDLDALQQEGTYVQTSNDIEDVTLVGSMESPEMKLQAANTDANGELHITEIPVGHYSIAEVKAPGDNYVRDYRSFYFTVDEKTVGKELQLYTEPQERTELKANTLKNYQKKVKLALVKYDPADGTPEIAGEKIKDGWQYTEDVLAEGNTVKGLQGAVYKLFMRRGAGAGVVNPYPKELESEKIIGYKQGYDTCVAVGTTGEDGVLRLSDMEGVNGKKIDGLNPEEYYMIEITPPEGYLLDQEAISFSLSGEVFPDDPAMEPGLVKIAQNQKTDYGLRLTKEDASGQAGIQGAGFEVRQGNKKLAFTGSDGVYEQSSQQSADAVTTVFTGADGKLTITGLEADTAYTFTETIVPQGYKKPELASITLKTAKSVQNGSLEGSVLFPRDEATVPNERLKGSVTLHKQEAETLKPLSGAEFTLYKTILEVILPGDPDYDPTRPGAVRSRDIAVDQGVTDQDGNLSFEELEWSDSYYLQETKAPDGYMLNQIKLNFSISQNSFDLEGKPISVQFPMLINRKGNLGEAVLYKGDADDPTLRLEDAHFYLEKYVGTSAAGKEIWVGYGQGMYKTDADGKIPFLLPQGDYRLSEMKAPDGYVLEGMKEVYFTIEETSGEEKPPLVVIDDGDGDGIVTNKKGETGVYVKKTLGLSDTPVSGVTFHIGWELIDPDTLETSYEPLYFVAEGDGEYSYCPDKNAPGATAELITGMDGEIYGLMPEGLSTPDPDKLSSLVCWEAAAPDGLVIDPTVHPIRLTEGIFAEVRVANKVQPEIEKDLSITIRKSDGNSGLALEGAEFAIYWYDGSGEGSQNSHILIGTGTTDAQGNLIFNQSNVSDLFGLMAGETYHIVETKAPGGYILDETHHEVVLDEKYFDDNFHFTGAVLDLNNGQMKGSVTLKKVAKDDHEKGLPGAEFELFRKDADASPMDPQWAHYGEKRYVTDENGILLIEDLPYGSYQLVERAAPLGYLLEDPAPVLTFQITQDGEKVDLGLVENPVDPNPVRDVFVTKVAAHDPDMVLAGAQFQLYRMAEDGEYHLLQQNVYETDDAGGFMIEDLPVGSYALKEIKAPDGYDLPQQDMTYFTVQVNEREVELLIENVKSAEPERPDPDDPNPQTPGDPNDPNPPTPGDPDDPNTPMPGDPDDPNTPTPGDPDDPNTPTPGDPDDPNSPTPGDPDDPNTPTPGEPGNPNNPTPDKPGTDDSTPKSGDDFNPLIWGGVLCLSGGAVIGALIRMRKKKEKR